MADPRAELADIVAPLAPAMVASPHSASLWIAALLGVLLAGLAWVVWRRGRSRRRLQVVQRAIADGTGSPAALAAQLDAWGRVYFGVSHLDADAVPVGIDALVWHDWVTALTQLRFAPQTEDVWTTLTALASAAGGWRRHA